MTRPIGFLGNLGRMMGHLGSDLLHKPAMIQSDAIILSTLLLVIARVIIAFKSAFMAPDVEQKNLRLREAIRTTMREVGGWVGSYLVLRAIRRGVQNAMNWAVGLQPANLPPVAYEKLAADFRQQWQTFWQGKPLPTPRPTALEALEASPPVVFSPQAPLLRALQRLGGHRAWVGLDPMAATKTLYKWLPISIGSLASLALSGFVLEWFTLNHADQVATALARLSPHHREPSPTEATPTTSSPAANTRQPPAPPPLPVRRTNSSWQDGDAAMARNLPLFSPSINLSHPARQAPAGLPNMPATYAVLPSQTRSTQEGRAYGTKYIPNAGTQSTGAPFWQNVALAQQERQRQDAPPYS
jgi:hypothetical protein